MARLTWQEVSNPNFSSANSAFGMMGELLKSASQPLDNALGRMQDAQTQRTSNQLMQAALSYQDPAAMQEALRSGSLFAGMDPRYINAGAMDMVQGQRASLLGERQTEANTALTGAQTNRVNQDVQHTGVRFNNEQDRLSAQREVELLRARVDELSRNGDVAGAQALLRQNAGLFGRAGYNVQTELGTPGAILGNQQEQIRADRSFVKEIEGFNHQDQAERLANHVIRTSRSPEEAARRLQDLRSEEGIAPQVIQGALGTVGTYAGTWGSSDSTLQGALSGLTGGVVPERQADNSWATQALGAAASGPRTSLYERVERQESGGNPRAVNPRTGASGVMQIMPDTARDPGFGVRPLDWDRRFDADENRRFGREYLDAMLDRYKGDEARALAAYNWGVGNADKWDGRLESLPQETRNYITNILGGTTSETPLSFGNNVPSSGDIPSSGSRVDQMFAAALQDPPVATQPGADPVEALREVALAPVNVEADTPELPRGNAPVRQTEQPAEGADFTTQALAEAAANPQEVWASVMARAPEVDPEASAAVQAQQSAARQRYIQDALRRTRDAYGTADNVVTRGLGALTDSAAGMWDYFTATPQEGAANAAAREAERTQRNQVWDTFNNPALVNEVNQNPELLQQALQDPVSFALARAAQGQPVVPPQAPVSQAAPTTAAPAGTQAAAAQQISAASAQAATAAGVSPDVISTPDAASPAALNALSNPLSAPPRPLQAANWNQAVSGVKNTMIMDATQNRLVGVDQAVKETQNPENASRPVIDVAKSFYDKYLKEREEGKWGVNRINLGDVERDLRWMQDSLGIPPHVGERILQELPPSWGFVQHGVDRTKVRELWDNYISARNESVAPGVSRLQALDEQKRRLDMLDQIDKTYKQYTEMGRKEGASPEMMQLNETVMRSVLAVIANSGLGTTPYSDGRFNKPAPEVSPN